MNQPAKAQEPSMEEILASIRRIIADDDAAKPTKDPEAPAVKPVAVAPTPPPAAKPAPPAPPPAPDAAAMNQDDIDAMLAGFEPPAPSPAPAPQPAPAVARRPEPEPEPEPDILDLTEAMAAPEPEPSAPPAFRTITSDPDVVFSEPEEPPPSAPRPYAPEPPRSYAPEPPRQAEPPHYSEPARNPVQTTEAPLMGSDTRAAVDAAFNSLAHTVLVQNARTLEDLVKEMLRPMLKAWLDDNLPSLVERLVRAEIERVSRGRT
jgi:cell pole-organizing protein PopZ